MLPTPPPKHSDQGKEPRLTDVNGQGFGPHATLVIPGWVLTVLATMPMGSGYHTDRFGDDAHGLGVLVSEQRQYGRAGAQGAREQDEERQLLLRVHAHLVKR